MTEPYDELFDDDKKEKKSSISDSLDLPVNNDHDDIDDDRFEYDEREPLDHILQSIRHFREKAESFSQLLSKTSAVDHKVGNNVLRLFLHEKNEGGPQNLTEERRYHKMLCNNFESIIVPMRKLAEIHLDTINSFNINIDDHYVSMDKTDKEVKNEISLAVNGLNMQRKILADGADDLEIIQNALIQSERRIKNYINQGGDNNISSSEYEIIISKRQSLTSGREHQFNYSFFDINFLDKTAISLGLYLKETSAQYLSKLKEAFM